MTQFQSFLNDSGLIFSQSFPSPRLPHVQWDPICFLRLHMFDNLDPGQGDIYNLQSLADQVNNLSISELWSNHVIQDKSLS